MSDLMPWMAPWSGRVLVFVLFLAGCAIVVRGWRNRKAGDTPHCPRCRYNMTGASSLACPECGHVSRDTAQLHAAHWWRTTILLGLLTIFGLPVFAIAQRINLYGPQYYLTFGPGYWLFGRKLLLDYTISGVFRVREYSDYRSFYRDDMRLTRIIRVDCNGTKVLEHEGVACVTTNPDLAHGSTFDANADGFPDLLVVESDGEPHPTFTETIIFSHGKNKPAVLETFNGRGGGSYEDLDGDGKIEMQFNDCPYSASWPCCEASRLWQPVIMRLRGEKFVFADDLMAAPKPHMSIESRAQILRERHFAKDLANGNQREGMYEDLGGSAMERIYAGRIDECHKLFQLVLVNHTPERSKFLQEFELLIRSSSVWTDLARINHLDANSPQFPWNTR